MDYSVADMRLPLIYHFTPNVTASHQSFQLCSKIFLVFAFIDNRTYFRSTLELRLVTDIRNEL